MDAPAWSNYDRKVTTEFINIFYSRRFNISGSMGNWMEMIMIKLSELDTVKNILGYNKYPRIYVLPDYLSSKASDKQVISFIEKHCENWEYNKLQKYEFKN